MTYRALMYIVCISAGLFCAFVASMLLDAVIIPDACYYHMHTPNIVISFLYDFPSWNGNHPTPSTAYLFLVAVVGATSGGVLAKRKIENAYK